MQNMCRALFIGNTLLFEVVLRFCSQMFWQRSNTAHIIQKVAAAHYTGGNFQPYLAFGRVYGNSLQIRQKSVIFLGSAQIPRAAVGVPSAVTFHWAYPRHLTYSRHCSLLTVNRSGSGILLPNTMTYGTVSGRRLSS